MKQIVRILGRRHQASAVFTALVLLAGLLSGCAGQKATLTPAAIVEKETLGNGVKVAVVVRDARSAPVIGLCNPASSVSGKLTMACDPAPAIKTAVERALFEKGFVPAPKSDAVVRTLTVELTDLTYKPTQTGAGLNAKATASLSVTADNNGQTMTRRYDSDTTWKLSGSDVEPEFDKLLSQTVSRGITRLASDYELIHFLEKTVLRTRDIKQ